MKYEYQDVDTLSYSPYQTPKPCEWRVHTPYLAILDMYVATIVASIGGGEVTNH